VFWLMLIFRQKLFSLQAKLLAAAFIFVAVTAATLLATHQAMADSVVYFDFYSSGESPNTYGADINNGYWEYYYNFSVHSDESAIVDISYEIDNSGRVSLEEFSDSGPFNDIDEYVYFYLDQRAYADFNPHTITFYATTEADEEISEQFSFEPYPDASSPVIYFDTYTEGEVESTSMPYYFQVYDDYLEEVVVYVDGQPWDVYPNSSNYDHQYYDLNLSSGYPGPSDLFDGNEHEFSVYARDPYGNESQQSYYFTYLEDGGGEDYEYEEDLPIFNFTEAPEGVTKNPLEYSGTVSDASYISYIQYEVDYEGRNYVLIDEDESSETYKEWEIEFSPSAGPHTITFYAGDMWGNEASQSFEVDIDPIAPSCTEGFINHPSPHYSKILEYEGITCTDDRGIVGAAYEIYHVVQGTLQFYADHPVQPVDSSFGATEETFDFTVDLSSFGDIDGVILVNFRVEDEAGNYSADYDPVIIDALDNSDPIVSMDEVTPDPLTDRTPTITGSCTDNTYRDTNSFISELEYQIDDGGYELITLPNGGVYDDSYTETFSVDLPELGLGVHTVDVRCTDGAGRSAVVDDTFTIVDPEDPMPGEFTFEENFESTANQDIPSSSNIIWGNGKLRLKEDITVSRQLLNNTNICPRYGDCRGLWEVWQDPQDSNMLWYYLGGQIYQYNKTTEVSTLFNYPALFGVNAMSSDLNGFALGVYEGKKYLWMSDIYRLYVFNLTDGVGFQNFTYTDIGAIRLDFERGRLGAYMTTTPTGGNSNLAYLDLNGTHMDQGDDVFTHYALSDLNSQSFLGSLIDSAENRVYAGSYFDGFYVWGDNNTPSDPSDDIVDVTTDGDYQNVFTGMILDPDGRLIFGTANNSNGRLFVITDDGDDPYSWDDDTIVQLAYPAQIGYRNIYGIQYIEGQNGVGDQLLLNTEGSIPVYLNFNDTYTNLTDDTFIEFDLTGGVRPSNAWTYLDNYSTLYSVNKNQGFYKSAMTRGWVDGGAAVAIPTRPPQQLVVDNFVAEANASAPIADASGVGGSNFSFMAAVGEHLIPQAYAAPGDPIRYYVSTDGGVTWQEVTLGQLQQLQQSDYRVKFKIELYEVDNATPVLTSYSLSYAGYPEEELATTTTGLSVSPSTNATTTNASFSVTVEGIDVLGYKNPNYDGNVTFTLIDTGTGNPTDGLNVTNLAINDGTGTASGVQINKTGTFKIRVTDGTFTQESGTITITSGASLPSPYLGFSASKFKIQKGEIVELHWASSNLTSFVINPGNNQLSAPTGTFYVHPTETTTYTITGTGPYGSAVASLEIKVEGELSSGTSSSPSPTPDASATPTSSVDPSATAGAGGGLANPSATPVPASFGIVSSADQTIVRGQKAEISWNIPDADEVTIDYPETRTISPNGSFEFFPLDTTVITITARKGDEVVTKKITVTVLDAPAEVQQIARALQERLPWSTPLISGAIQASKTLPKIGLAAAAALELAVVGLLALAVASQAGIMAALNLRTLLNLFRTAGVLPAKQRKGFVHQTKNGSPIPFAAISVYEGKNQLGAPFVSLVSDMYGVYLEPFLPKGEYTMTVGHDGHVFPTKLQRPAHLSFKDFYKGEVLGIASAKQSQAVLVPMDNKLGDKGGSLKYSLLLLLNRTLHWLQWAVYPLAALSILAFWIAPTVINGLILVVYAVVLLPKLVSLFKKPTLKGRIIADGDRRGIANATIVLTRQDGSVVAISKSDAHGNFELYAPKGKYGINVISPNMVWKEAKAGTMSMVTAAVGAKPLTIEMTTITNPFAAV